MNRRELIAGLMLPLMARAGSAQQPGRVYRLAILTPSTTITDISETGQSRPWRTFFQELRRLGYLEGVNLTVDRRSTGGQVERVGELARELVAARPDVIYVASGSFAQAVKQVDSTVPIVAILANPVELGLAKSLSNPGGNVTGVTVDAGVTVPEKYLEILRSINPKASRVGWLAPRAQWSEPDGQALRDAAASIGISILGPPVDSPLTEAEYARVVGLFAQNGADSILVSDAAINYPFRQAIVKMVNASKLPALYAYVELPRLGGLIAYGGDLDEQIRIAVGHIDRIFRGAKPGELPFVQPTKWQLVINLITAKELGVTIPESLLIRADEVIE